MPKTPHSEESDPERALAESAFEAGQVIRSDCQAAPIAEVSAFAECLVKTGAFCRHRFAFSNYRYCVHPKRQAIIARTLAEQGG